MKVEGCVLCQSGEFDPVKRCDTVIFSLALEGLIGLLKKCLEKICGNIKSRMLSSYLMVSFLLSVLFPSYGFYSRTK